MKTSYATLLIFLLLIASSVKAQEPVNNFQVTNGEITWQWYYPTTMTFEQLQEEVKDSGLLKNIEIANNKIRGDVKSIEVSNTDYLGMSNYYGFAVIDFKDGKYRVTLKNITKRSFEINNSEKISLEFSVLNKKNELRDIFLGSPALMLHKAFFKKFDFKATTGKW